MSETIWVMDSECCCRCGALLDYFECILCTNCLENAMYDAEQERFLDWYEDAEWPPIDTLEDEDEHLLADED